MTAGEDEQQPYVLFLARQGRISDALELLPKREPAVLLDLATHTLNGGNASEAELKQLIEALQQSYDAAPQLVNLLVMMADVLAWQGDIDGAIAQYEKALAQDARSIPALNNLATLLGFTKREIPKAVSAINEAIRVMGPHDILLDTRGTVLLSAGNAAAAEADFRAAIETNPLPDRLFHLALALRDQGKMAEARTALAQARQKGLSADGLHPLERPVFTNLAAEL
jgi:tetratricopeptide (TPR) repeat protein